MTRVTRQMEEETRKATQQKQEEINRVNEGLEEHRARLLAEVKAREENSRYAANVFAGCVKKHRLSTSLNFILFLYS